MKNKIIIIVLIVILGAISIFGITKLLSDDKNSNPENKNNELKNNGIIETDNTNSGTIILELSSKVSLKVENGIVKKFYQLDKEKELFNYENYRDLDIKEFTEKIINEKEISKITISLFEGDYKLVQEMITTFKNKKVKVDEKELNKEEKSELDKKMSKYIDNLIEDDKNNKEDDTDKSEKVVDDINNI